MVPIGVSTHHDQSTLILELQPKMGRRLGFPPGSVHRPKSLGRLQNPQNWKCQVFVLATNPSRVNLPALKDDSGSVWQVANR